LLIKNGANIEAKNNMGQTPLDMLIRHRAAWQLEARTREGTELYHLQGLPQSYHDIGYKKGRAIWHWDLADVLKNAQAAAFDRRGKHVKERNNLNNKINNMSKAKIKTLGEAANRMMPMAEINTAKSRKQSMQNILSRQTRKALRSMKKIVSTGQRGPKQAAEEMRADYTRKKDARAHDEMLATLYAGTGVDIVSDSLGEKAALKLQAATRGKAARRASSVKNRSPIAMNANLGGFSRNQFRKLSKKKRKKSRNH